MKSVLTLLLVLGLYSMLLYAQNESVVMGRVIDSKTGVGLPGAHVFTTQQTGVMTDESGYFAISLPLGNHDIKFQFICGLFSK